MGGVVAYNGARAAVSHCGDVVGVAAVLDKEVAYGFGTSLCEELVVKVARRPIDVAAYFDGEVSAVDDVGKAYKLAVGHTVELPVGRMVDDVVQDEGFAACDDLGVGDKRQLWVVCGGFGRRIGEVEEHVGRVVEAVVEVEAVVLAVWEMEAVGAVVGVGETTGKEASGMGIFATDFTGDGMTVGVE